MVAAGLLALAPAAALAFETVDSLPFPSTGAFPTWRGDPVGLWTLSAYAGAMYDNNPLRRATAEQSDVVARYGVGVRATPRVVGRQRVLLEGIGEYYDYNRFSDIDHFAYALRGDWLWQIGNQLDGAAGYSRLHRHADLGEFRSERRVMVTSDRLFVDGGYRFAPDWRLFGGADHTRAKRAGDDGDEVNASTVRGSLTHSTALGNAIGVELRATHGDTGAAEALTGVSNDYDEYELAATLTYALGAQLRIGGRVGRTERSYDDVAGRDFSGTTYRGRVDWLPESKLIFSFEAYREPTSVIDIDAAHVLRTGTAFGVRWAATFKLVFTASFVRERRENQGDPSVVLLGIVPRDETVRTWRFGAGWEPQRHWQLGAALDIGERSANFLGRDYDYTQAMLNLRFTY